jgi:phosphoadenosine phosphosulfate reductase
MADKAPSGERGDFVAEAAAQLENATALEILTWAVTTFGDGIVVTSSMQDAVVPHLASQVKPGIKVLFLDTGYHFAETIGMRDAVDSVYDVEVVNVVPQQTVEQQDAEYGRDLFARDPDLCCALRKVEPLQDAMRPYTAWITGLRRAEATSRAVARTVEWDADRRRVKVNPIVRWSDGDVERYIEEHNLLVNPLRDDGYPSIGCAPCTRRVAPGEDPRAGRWAGQNKSECGLHTGVTPLTLSRPPHVRSAPAPTGTPTTSA